MDLITRLHIKFLENFYSIAISLRTLKCCLTDYGLDKFGSDISNASLRVIMEREVSEPSPLKGYRNIWNNLPVTDSIKVSRDKLMKMLRNIDRINSTSTNYQASRTRWQSYLMTQ